MSAVLVNLVVLLNWFMSYLTMSYFSQKINKYADDDDEDKTNFSRRLKQFDGLT